MTEETDNAVSIATISAQLSAVTSMLGEVKDQTTLTNGRVTSLEAWRNKFIGAWFVLSLLGPVVTGLIVGYILSK